MPAGSCQCGANRYSVRYGTRPGQLTDVYAAVLARRTGAPPREMDPEQAQ